MKESPLAPFTDFVYCKGEGRFLLDEIGKIVEGRANYDLDPVERALMRWVEKKIPFKVAPVSYTTVVPAKDRKSSVGMPWKNTWSTYADMLLDVSYDEIATCCCEIEEAILDGKDYFSLYYLFSKLDKYSAKKILTNAYRSIQVSDFFILFMLQRYLAALIETLELSISQFFLITTRNQYKLKVSKHYDRHSFGIDFSHFDKSETSDLMRMTMRVILSRSQMPVRLQHFLIEAICSPLYLLPTMDGTIVSTGSSNPSGQFCTSICNSFNHLVYNLVINKMVLGIDFDDYLNETSRSLMTATGDDGIESTETKDDCMSLMHNYPVLLRRIFGIHAKIEGVTLPNGNVDSFPPGVLPPYLSTVEVVEPGRRILVPSRITRMLPTLQYCNTNDLTNPDNYEERLAGVAVACSGFSVLAKTVPNYPIPQPYIALTEVMEDHGIELPVDPRSVSDVLVECAGTGSKFRFTMPRNNKSASKPATNVTVVVPTQGNKTQANKPPPRRRRGGRGRGRKPPPPPKRARAGARNAPRMRLPTGRAYMDPEGKTKPPASSTSLGYFTPIQGVTRYTELTSTTFADYFVFQWCPSSLRGIVIRNDGTWNIAPIRIDALENNQPFATRPLRMSVEVVNSTSMINASGNVTVAMASQQINWKSIILDDGVHGTAAGIAQLDAFLAGYSKTQVYSANDFIHSKTWVFFPVSSVGYHEWLDFGANNYTSWGNGFLKELEPGADQDALSTLIIRVGPTPSVNTYTMTCRVQEACRYPLNTALGNLTVAQPYVNQAVIQSIHQDAQLTGHHPVSKGPLDSIAAGIRTGANIVSDAGRMLANAYGIGRGLSSMIRAGRAATPIVEEIAEVAPLAIMA